MDKAGKDFLVEKLDRFIAKNQVSQKKIAQDLNIAQATVCRWLTGENGITRRHREKVKKYIQENVVNDSEYIKVAIDRWPLAKEQAQDVINYYSMMENRKKLFQLLVDIQDTKENGYWDLIG